MPQTDFYVGPHGAMPPMPHHHPGHHMGQAEHHQEEHEEQEEQEQYEDEDSDEDYGGDGRRGGGRGMYGIAAGGDPSRKRKAPTVREELQPAEKKRKARDPATVGEASFQPCRTLDRVALSWAVVLVLLQCGTRRAAPDFVYGIARLPCRSPRWWSTASSSCAWCPASWCTRRRSARRWATTPTLPRPCDCESYSIPGQHPQRYLHAAVPPAMPSLDT